MKNILNKLHYISLLLLASFPLYPRNITVITIIVFTLISLLTLIQNKNLLHTKNNRIEFLIWVLPFLLILISSLIDNSQEAYFYLERSISLLIFPLIFFILPFRYNEKHQNVIFGVFLGASFVSISWGFIKTMLFVNSNISKNIEFNNDSILERLSRINTIGIREHFEKITALHPSYASIFIAISALYVLNYLLKKYTNFSKLKILSYSTLLILLVTYQAYLAARMPFFAIFPAFLTLFILHNKNLKSISIVAIVLLLFGMLFIQIPSMKQRVVKVPSSLIPTEKKPNKDPVNIRVSITMCSLDIIKKNWLTGVGVGKVQEKLNKCYTKLTRRKCKERSFNTHNQWLDYFCGIGILGPLALLVLMLQVTIKNIVRKNYLAPAIVVLFGLCFLTENILVRQDGIVPFAFFLSFFSFYNEEKKVFKF